MEMISPLKKHEQSAVTKIAILYGLKANCKGSGKKGCVTLYRTPRTRIADKDIVDKLLEVLVLVCRFGSCT